MIKSFWKKLHVLTESENEVDVEEPSLNESTAAGESDLQESLPEMCDGPEKQRKSQNQKK